jgi:hypothetical protein
MKFIRTFWGDINGAGGKYLSQMKSISHQLDEVVYVWGKENYDVISGLGFKCILVSEEPYDYTLASNHILLDHKSANHKLKCLDMAVRDYGEVLILDWDCYPVREIDDEFYSIMRKGFPLQLPLYVYPRKAIDLMIEKTTGQDINPFFHKLKKFINLHSYGFNDSFVIPNCGFMYCRNRFISSKLFDLSMEYELESVADEFAVMVYSELQGYSLEDYITNLQPSTISGKFHDDEWWLESQIELNNYISNIKPTKLYFEHN